MRSPCLRTFLKTVSRCTVGNDAPRGDFGKRHDDEGTLVHARVRNGKSRFMQHEIAVEREVEIERTWAIRDTAHATVAAFDLEQGFKQRAWTETCRDLRHGIDEVRLVAKSDGRAAVEGRYTLHNGTGHAPEIIDAAPHVCLGMIEVAAERDKGGDGFHACTVTRDW